MFVESRKLGRIGVQIAFALIVGAVGLLSGCEQKATSDIKIENETVSKTGSAADTAVVNAFLQEKARNVKIYVTQMSELMAGAITIDQTQSTNEKGVPVPALLLNGKLLNGDHTIPETLTAQSSGGAVATIFVRSGNEFIRIATSLKRSNDTQVQEGENRATGSLLDHTQPAYSAIMGGNAYIGTATLFGNIYVTEYNPIKDKDGNIIGIQFVGMEITADVFQLKRKLGAV